MIFSKDLLLLGTAADLPLKRLANIPDEVRNEVDSLVSLNHKEGIIIDQPRIQREVRYQEINEAQDLCLQLHGGRGTS
jgi:hypothetical protein